MSAAALSWALSIRGLRPNDSLTLIRLADLSNGECEAFPTINGLAEHIGVTRRTLFRSIHTLEDTGAIERINRFRPDGSQTSTCYRLLVPRFFTANTPVSELPTPSDTEVTLVTGNPVQVTSNNPPIVPPESHPFLDFKGVYPKRLGGQRWQEAEKKWQKLDPAARQVVLDGVDGYVAHLKDRGKLNSEWVLQAATFLNQKAYLEFLDQPTKAKLNRLPKGYNSDMPGFG